MDNRIKEAFGRVHAQEDLKENTKAFIAKNLRGENSHDPAKVRFFALAACAAVLIFLGVGTFVYFLPTASISIDINPSLELFVNRFDRVISLVGRNDDGIELSKSLSIRFMQYDDAVTAILESETVAALMSSNNNMEVYVTSDDGVQCQRMMEGIELCTSGHQNAHCYIANPAEAEAAREMGLSLGKYRAYLELLEVYPDTDITADDLNNMTMREIRELINSARGSAVTSSPHNGEQNGQGNGHHGNRGQHGQ